MTLEEWQHYYPDAAHALRQIIIPQGSIDTPTSGEAAVQSLVRIAASREGWRLWRNNIGATQGDDGRWVRYGLANDSMALNAAVKSADLIGVRPVFITPQHVGSTIGQFVSLECKRPGFRWDKRCDAQARWAQIIVGLGGYAKFTTGEL